MRNWHGRNQPHWQMVLLRAPGQKRLPEIRLLPQEKQFAGELQVEAAAEPKGAQPNLAEQAERVQPIALVKPWLLLTKDLQASRVLEAELEPQTDLELAQPQTIEHL